MLNRLPAVEAGVVFTMGAADPATLLGQTFVFSRLSPEELARLVSAFSVGRFEPGETIARQGNPIHAWHVVESGRADDENRTHHLRSHIHPRPLTAI